MGRENRFTNLFSTDMSSDEARYVLYSHCDGLTESELEELKEAYSPAADVIMSRELEDNVI